MSSSSSVPANPSSHNVASLLPKLQDHDPDIRFMTLTDINKMLETGGANFISHDYATCAKVVEGLLHTLNDTNGDVQNMSIKTLGNFIPKAPETILAPTIEKVSNLKTDNSIDTTVAALAVRAIVVALVRPEAGVPRSQKVQESYNAVSKALIPRLIGKIVIPIGKGNPAPPKGMLQDDVDSGNDSNSLDLLTEVAKCFGPMLQDAEVQALEQATMQVLQSEKCGTVMKKKAVAALSSLAPYFSEDLLASHVSYSIEQLRQSHLTPQQRKLYLTIFGSLARSIPQKFGPYLRTLAPFVLSPLSQGELEQQQEAEAEAEGERDTEMEEVREAALIALECFFQTCSQDMRAYTKGVVECTTRFLKYEPNVASDDEDEEMDEADEDEGYEGDEDFEEETGFEDEDDVSWKVRRCSAKTLHALVATISPNDPAMYGQIAPALISRFKEREESVRTEVIATLAFLIARTGSTSGTHKDLRRSDTHHTAAPQSRKRRRGFSDTLGSDLSAHQASMNGYASPTTPPPVDDATQGLAKLNPEVIKASAELLKTSTVPTKLAVISLLKDMITAQSGGLSTHADQVVDPVVDTLTLAQTGVSTNTVAANALRVEALQLLRVLAETHNSAVLQPHLSKIVPALTQAARDRYAKVSGEAFATIEVVVKALTPPRSGGGQGAQNKEFLEQLYTVIVDRISASETDTDVRQHAVKALGLLIGRTSGASGDALLKQDDRLAGQQLLAERLKNELTRLSCVRAIETMAVLAQRKENYRPGFVDTVALELGAQLRKSSRSLRGASLGALRMLSINPASRVCFSEGVVEQLVAVLVPLLKTEDLHMMSPALIVLAAFASGGFAPAVVGTKGVIVGICEIVTQPLSGQALESLVACVDAIGAAHAGQGLMKALLDVGVKGDTDVSGQAIGTLLVAGGEGVGVSVADFEQELKSQTDETKKCLALSVLGETGLRMGSKCGLRPETFISCFADQSEKVQLAAAVALGRAGAGNIHTYLPKLLEALGRGRQYLLLHSVKELLQHANAEEEIKPFTAPLWNAVIASGQTDDNKVVGAECIGRLAIIDPAAYLPQLSLFLSNDSASIRGMVISALRYVFSDTDAAYDVNLADGKITAVLATMLADTDLNNQRLALSIFNSALHNKPTLVLPQLSELLPFAMQATVLRPELVREVQMGPFKHKVDDGLEIRKSAYETLYNLLDTPSSRAQLDVPAFYTRVIAGVGDEHEIKILCCLVLGKLLILYPAESGRRLEQLASVMRAVLGFKPKEGAVKQEVEKVEEARRAVVRVTVGFTRVFAGEVGERAWREFVEWVKREFGGLVKGLEEEGREK